jgi:hypothetical protein
MALTLFPNYEPISDHEGWWYLKESIIAGGGGSPPSVKSSSDGTTFGAGDNLSPGGPYPQSGAGSFVTTGAWMVIQFPAVAGVTREICLQKTSTTGRITFYYSSDGTGFTGGGATTRPTAADEQFLQNNADNVFGTTNPQRQIMTVWAHDADEGYSWLMELHEPGTRPINAGAFMDVVSSPYSGDTDPAVLACFTDGQSYYVHNSAVITSTAVDTATTNIAGWYDLGGPAEAWVAWPIAFPGYDDASPQPWVNDIQQPMPDGKYISFPAIYIRGDALHASEAGYKGVSRLFRVTSRRNSLETVGLSSNRQWIANYGIVRAWDGSSVPRW